MMAATFEVIDSGIDATPSALDVRDFSDSDGFDAEQALFAAALEQAILDLGGPSQREKEVSIRLLTESTGEFADHRMWLCFQAGIDPDAFFEKVAPMARQASRTPISKGKGSPNRQQVLAAIKKEAKDVRKIN